MTLCMCDVRSTSSQESVESISGGGETVDVAHSFTFQKTVKHMPDIA